MSPNPLPHPLSAPGEPTQSTVSAAIPRSPSWPWLWSHPAHFVAAGFGSGLLRPGPGTWGTVAGWVLFVVLDRWLSDAMWIALIALTFAIGCWAAQRAGDSLGRADHGSIVIDEIVAFWIVLLLVPSTLLAQALAFVVFRFFDIVKPPPIGALDRRFKNGVGVMIDDLVAALYTLLLAAVAARIGLAP
ncbi:MAG: phosphatidylglycerophosphatase A family protein [Burkholderiaceae bacterium]